MKNIAAADVDRLAFCVARFSCVRLTLKHIMKVSVARRLASGSSARDAARTSSVKGRGRGWPVSEIFRLSSTLRVAADLPTVVDPPILSFYSPGNERRKPVSESSLFPPFLCRRPRYPRGESQRVMVGFLSNNECKGVGLEHLFMDRLASSV